MKTSKFGREMKEEGRLEARRADILDMLEEKFGAGMREECESSLTGISDFDRLGRLHRLARAVLDINRFRSALTKAETTTI